MECLMDIKVTNYMLTSPTLNLASQLFVILIDPSVICIVACRAAIVTQSSVQKYSNSLFWDIEMWDNLFIITFPV